MAKSTTTTVAAKAATTAAAAALLANTKPVAGKAAKVVTPVELTPAEKLAQKYAPTIAGANKQAADAIAGANKTIDAAIKAAILGMQESVRVPAGDIIAALRKACKETMGEAFDNSPAEKFLSYASNLAKSDKLADAVKSNETIRTSYEKAQKAARESAGSNPQAGGTGKAEAVALTAQQYLDGFIVKALDSGFDDDMIAQMVQLSLAKARKGAKVTKH